MLAALAAIVDGAVSSTRENVHRGLPRVGSHAVLILVTSDQEKRHANQLYTRNTFEHLGDSLRMYGLLVRISSWKTTASGGGLWNRTEEG